MNIEKSFVEFNQTFFVNKNENLKVEFLLDTNLDSSTHIIPCKHTATVVGENQFSSSSFHFDGIWGVFPHDTHDAKSFALKTADCLAVVWVVSLKNHTLYSLFHAGWRGFTQDIQGNVFKNLSSEILSLGYSLEELFQNSSVLVSPAIFGTSYACGYDVRRELTTHREHSLMHNGISKPLSGFWEKFCDMKHDSSVSAQILNREEDKIYPDFQLLLLTELLERGFPLESVKIIRSNTYQTPWLPSYRRATHQGENTQKRMWTKISIGRSLKSLALSPLSSLQPGLF